MSSTRPLNPGDVVRIRDQRWRVESQVRHGDTVGLNVVGTERENRGYHAHYLLPFERCELLPHDARPRRVGGNEWRRVVRRILADATPSWHALRTAARCHFAIIPFQLEPALALVRRKACRILIADAVGLGKTVQAGLMIAETLERTPGAHVLVIAPASLRDQWIAELHERFSLDAALLDAAMVPRAATTAAAGMNPWVTMPLAVTSIDYVKRADVIRGLEGIIWDLIVFDEAHALTGRSDRGTAAAALARRARAVVMLSATPHSGDEAAFDRLRTTGDIGDEFPLLVFRRTRDALGKTVRRRVRHLRVRPSEAEAAMHDALQSYARRVWRETDAPGARLALSVLLRRATSSAASLVTSLERRLSLLSEATALDTEAEPLLPFVELLDTDASPERELATPAFANREAELEQLRHVLELARRASAAESKLRLLSRLLARIDDTAIVFTEYRDTLATLANGLGREHAMLHGGLSSSERRDHARRFTHGDARLLLATDAASEGLNLQRRCRLVIHLEMPWTPTRLEQRIGRVDRLGQHRRVHSIHLVAAGTHEDDVAERVRLRAVRASQGMAGALSTGLDSDVANQAATAGVEGAIDPVELADEVARLETARRLQRRAAEAAPIRPVVTIARRRSMPPAIWALGVPFNDAQGDVIWQLLVALVMPSCPPDSQDLAALRPCELALQPIIDLALARLRPTLGAAVESMIARDQAIARELSAQRARLSAALLQRGLFEHRGERLASAQDEVLRTALERLSMRIASLEHFRQITPAAPVWLFGAARARCHR